SGGDIFGNVRKGGYPTVYWPTRGPIQDGNRFPARGYGAFPWLAKRFSVGQPGDAQSRQPGKADLRPFDLLERRLGGLADRLPAIILHELRQDRHGAAGGGAELAQLLDRGEAVLGRGVLRRLLGQNRHDFLDGLAQSAGGADGVITHVRIRI